MPSRVTWNDAAGLLPVAVSMLLVILAQSAATSRVYAVRYNEHYEANTDLVGLSLANLSAGLSGAFVVNGSPTKTEMVDEAKSRTQVAQLATAAVVVIVLLFLTKPLEYLPNAVLSSVVFLIGLKLIAVKDMHAIYRLRKDEFWIALLTALVRRRRRRRARDHPGDRAVAARPRAAPLLTARRGDALGRAGTRTLTPPVPGAMSEPGLVVYRFGVGLFYANAQRLTEEVMGLVNVPNPPRWLVLHAEAVDDIDYTGAQTLLELADQLKQRGIVFAVADATDHVRNELDRFGLTERIGSDHYFASVHDARDAFHAT